MRDENWKGVFDVTPLDDDWVTRGNSIQTTFWKLRCDRMRKARPFTSAHSRR